MAGPLKVIDLTFVLGVLLKAAITLPMVRFIDTCASTVAAISIFSNKVQIKRALWLVEKGKGALWVY